MKRTLQIAGCGLWIAGLAGTIIGLNLEGTTGTWVAVAGTICFLIGLALVGIVWFRDRKNKEGNRN